MAVRTGKRKQVTLKGKASFKSRWHHWGSHHASATWTLNRRGDRAVCIKCYKQQSQKTNEWVKPRFKFFEKMRSKAYAILTSPKKAANDHPAAEFTGSSSHEYARCERCEELGAPCTKQYVDVCDRPFRMNREAAKARRNRLKKSKTTTLYHQTSRENANQILKSDIMKPGTRGLAGGGIYFAETPNDTNGKAHRRGVILQCEVKLGRVKTLPPGGDPSMDIVKLLTDPDGPYDAVKVPRPRPEWVVYVSDQVVCIKEV